jgi:hypothetical protein
VVRILLVLAVGVAIGYVYGYKDARTHDKMVVERALDRAEGVALKSYRTTADQANDSAGR